MNAQVEMQRFKLDVNRYHQMIAAGVFGEDDRVELIEGELITMVPPKPAHAEYVDLLSQALRAAVGLKLRVQNPITLPQHSEPQPDLALVIAKSYFDRHPLPEDVKLIIEVSDSSLDKDKLIKLPLYARYGIPEVWILDVAGQAVESYWSPGGLDYRRSSRSTHGRLVSATLPEIGIELDTLWPSG